MDFLVKIYKWLEKMMQPIHDFIIEHHGSPWFWLIIFAGGLIIFNYVYNELRKEK